MTGTAPQPDGRLLARNTLLNLFGMGAPMLVALLAVPILIGGLGTERFGVLALAWMLLAYLGELGFGATTTKFISEAIGAGYDDDLGAIAWTSVGMQFVVGLLEGVALALATPWLVERAFNIDPALWAEARTCLYLLAAALPIIGLSRSFQGVLEAGQRFDLITAVRIPATVANYALPMGGVLLGWSLPAIFGLVLASRTVVLVVYAALAGATFPALGWRPRLHGRLWREMLGFGGWTAVSGVISPLIVYSDRFFIGVLLSMTAVTMFAAPYELIVRLSIVPMAVVATLYPAFSQMVGGGQWARTGLLAARSVKAILLVIGPIALVLIGAASEGLRLWLGPEFAGESALALQILGIGVLINATAQVPYVLLQGAGRPDIPARFHLVELPIHLLVSWLLIRSWGIPGAALAWSLRVTLDAVLLFVAADKLALLRLADLRRERVVRTAALIGVAAVGVSMPMDAVSALPRLGIVGAVALAVIPLIWRFGLDHAERTRIVSLLRPVPSS